MAFSADLKNTLLLNPQITIVWFNQGQTAWLFTNEVQQTLNLNNTNPGIAPSDPGVAYNYPLSAAYVLAN